MAWPALAPILAQPGCLPKMVLLAKMIPPAFNRPPYMGQLLLPKITSLKGPSGSCADFSTCFLQTEGQRWEGQTESSVGITCSLYKPPAPLVAHPPVPGAGPHHLLLNEGPDDSRHLISVHLHHRVCHLDPLVGIWRAVWGRVRGAQLHTLVWGQGILWALSSQVWMPPWLRDRDRSGASPPLGSGSVTGANTAGVGDQSAKSTM